MTRKKTTEAVSVSSPKTSVSIPIEKKSRAKSLTASTKASSEKAELLTKPAHKRRKTQEVVEVVIPTSNTSISNLADAVVMDRPLHPEEVATRAYLYWLERGCPEGSGAEDWFRAESELRNQAACA